MKPRQIRIRQAALVVALGAFLVLLPFIAVVLFVTRFVLLGGVLLAALLGTLTFALSPRFRDWLRFRLEPGLSYAGLRLDTDVALDRSHAWARLSGRSASVGVDDWVQAVLGPVHRVELPALGTRARLGRPLFRLHHGKRCLQIASPVDGMVLDCNAQLARDPGLVNTEPFGRGWTVRIGCDRPREQKRRLLRGADARRWFRDEIDRLLTDLSPGTLAPTLPDGGVLVPGLHRQIDDATWARIERRLQAPDPATRPAA